MTTEGTRERRRRVRNPDVEATPSAESASVEEEVPAKKQTRKPATKTAGTAKAKPAPKNKTAPRADFGPFVIEGKVSEPPGSDNHNAELVMALIEDAESGEWTIINPGERKPNTIQSALQVTAKKYGYTIQTRYRGEEGNKRLYVRAIVKGGDSETAADSDSE